MPKNQPPTPARPPQCDPKKETERLERMLLEGLCRLANTATELCAAAQDEIARRKSRGDPVTLNDLRRMEKRIMDTQDDLVAAATAISTVADGTSLKIDDMVTKLDAFLAAAASVQLPPAAVTALAALKKSKDSLAAAGDKVDAEVTKLDGVLPTPAPAGPPVVA